VYRVTYEIADFLIKDSRNTGLKSISDFSKPLNAHAIGFIDPFVSIGAEFDYVIYCDTYVPATEYLPEYTPEVEGYWLCKRDEIKMMTEPVLIPRSTIDLNFTGSDESIDISDCCVAEISAIDRMTCPVIYELKRLLELEPGVKECLITFQEK